MRRSRVRSAQHTESKHTRQQGRAHARRDHALA
jgi:hypothetical protein